MQVRAQIRLYNMMNILTRKAMHDYQLAKKSTFVYYTVILSEALALTGLSRYNQYKIECFIHALYLKCELGILAM